MPPVIQSNLDFYLLDSRGAQHKSCSVTLPPLIQRHTYLSYNASQVSNTSHPTVVFIMQTNDPTQSPNQMTITWPHDNDRRVICLKIHDDDLTVAWRNHEHDSWVMIPHCNELLKFSQWLNLRSSQCTHPFDLTILSVVIMIIAYLSNCHHNHCLYINFSSWSLPTYQFVIKIIAYLNLSS